MAGNASDLSMGFAVTGADDVARSLQSVAGQLERLTQKQQANTTASNAQKRATEGANNAFGQMVQQGQQVTQRIQSVAGAVQSLVSQMGSRDRTAGLVASIAANVAQFSQMGSLLGPGGAIVGGLVGMASATVALANEQRDLAGRTAEATQAIRDQAEAAGEARERLSEMLNLGAATGRRDMASAFLADAGTSDLVAQAAAAREALATLERVTSSNGMLRSVVESGTLTENRAGALTGGVEARAALGVTGASTTEDARARLATLDQEIERRRELAATEAREAEANAAATAERRRLAEEQRGLEDEWQESVRNASDLEDARRAAAIRGAAERAEAVEAAYAREAAAAAEVNARELALLQARAEEAAKAADAAAEADAERVAEALKSFDDLIAKQRDVAALNEEMRHTADELTVAFGTGYVNSLEAVADAWTETRRAQRAAGQDMLSSGRLLERSMVAIGNNISETIGGTMVGAFEKALGAWLDGSKSFVEAAEEMVKGVLKALVIESIVQAVTETARGIADLASYRYDSGAMHLAAAGAWAAVGVAAGAVGAGIGAFGGGGGGSSSSAQNAPTSRELAGSQSSERGGDTYNIEVYPGGYVTRDEVAGGLVDGLNRAARNGRTVDSRLVRR